MFVKILIETNEINCVYAVANVLNLCFKWSRKKRESLNLNEKKVIATRIVYR